MVLDYFNTTYEGARQGLGSFGQAIGELSHMYAKNKMDERLQDRGETKARALRDEERTYQEQQRIKEQEDTLNFMRKFGILKEEPADVLQWEKELGGHAKEIGIDKLNIEGSANPEERVNQIKTIFDTFKLPYPKSGKGTVDAELMAKLGIDYKATPSLSVKPSSLNDTEGMSLSDEQRLQGRALAKKLYGVRGIEAGLPAIYRQQESGKRIDEIEDSLRFSGQSGKMVGDFRNAAQSILINNPETVSQKAMDYIDDFLEKGDTEGAKEQLKRLARKESGVEEARYASGRERTIKLLDEIQDDLNTLESNGIDTNIFSGTAEQVAQKIGQVKEPGLRKAATKISAAIQNYRRSMSGVAFSVPESKEYKEIFPSIGRTANFNNATINALKEVFSGDLENFYSLAMGDQVYKNLFGNADGSKGQDSGQQSIQVLTATNPQTGQQIKSMDGGKTWQ